MKVFWLFNHPAPYKVDFFNLLGKQCDLTVLFERSSESGRNNIFYSEKSKGYNVEIADSIFLGGINNITFYPLHYLSNRKFDIVVLNGWRTFSEQIAIQYCRNHKIPYIFYINGGILNPNESNWKKKYKTHYIKGANAYFAPDEKSSEYLCYYGADKEKIIKYPYSSVFEKDLVNAPLTQEEKIALREKLGLVGKQIYVSSGQFIERKNFEELIRVWTKMPEDSSLYITGEGPLADKLQELIDELHLHNVSIKPYMPHDQLFELYRAADTFVLLSKEDIYGHVVNEALSQGIPVVAGNNINAATHLIKNGENGYVVELGKEDEIVEALKNTINPEFGTKALATAKENTIEKSVSFHVDAFRSYLQKRKKENILLLTTSMPEDAFQTVVKNGCPLNPAGQNFYQRLVGALRLAGNTKTITLLPKGVKAPTCEDNSILVERKGSGSAKESIVKAYKESGFQADVIFYDSLNIQLTFAAKTIAKECKIPAVAVCTDDPNNITGVSIIYPILCRFASRFAKATLALTPKLSKIFGGKKKPSILFPGIAEKTNPGKSRLNAPYLYYGGALFAKDGTRALLNAYLRSNPDIHLVIAGHGEMEEEVELSSKKNPKIHFLGQISAEENAIYQQNATAVINPRIYRKKLDAVSVPSKDIEYLVNAKVILATPASSLQKEFKDDIYWLPEKELAIENEIYRFLSNPYAAKYVRNNAKEKALELLGKEALADQIKKFLLSF